MSKLTNIQSKLKAPKGQVNKFGGYKYRSCEDILEAVKPLLAEEGLDLIIEDDVVVLGERFYVKATAKLFDGEVCIASATAFAREADEKKGMDVSQITGAASSYARKYALNGLLCIDDTKDADATNKGESCSSLKKAIENCKTLQEFIELGGTIKASASNFSPAEYDELKKLYNEKNKTFNN